MSKPRFFLQQISSAAQKHEGDGKGKKRLEKKGQHIRKIEHALIAGRFVFHAFVLPFLRFSAVGDFRSFQCPEITKPFLLYHQVLKKTIDNFHSFDLFFFIKSVIIFHNVPPYNFSISSYFRPSSLKKSVFPPLLTISLKRRVVSFSPFLCIPSKVHLSG